MKSKIKNPAFVVIGTLLQTIYLLLLTFKHDQSMMGVTRLMNTTMNLRYFFTDIDSEWVNVVFVPLTESLRKLTIP